MASCSALLPLDLRRKTGEHRQTQAFTNQAKEATGGEPAIIGRSLAIAGGPAVVVGILPQGASGEVDVWWVEVTKKIGDLSAHTHTT